MQGSTKASDAMPAESLLRQVSLFGGLMADQLRPLLAMMPMMETTAGQLIFKQGDPPGCIYIIRSGRVRIQLENVQPPMELATFSTGDCFGETSAIGLLPHTASAYAMEASVLWTLPTSALHRLYHEDPFIFGILIMNIARESCRRLHQTDQTLLHYAHPAHP